MGFPVDMISHKALLLLNLSCLTRISLVKERRYEIHLFNSGFHKLKGKQESEASLYHLYFVPTLVVSRGKTKPWHTDEVYLQ